MSSDKISKEEENADILDIDYGIDNFTADIEEINTLTETDQPYSSVPEVAVDPPLPASRVASVVVPVQPASLPSVGAAISETPKISKTPPQDRKDVYKGRSSGGSRHPPPSPPSEKTRRAEASRAHRRKRRQERRSATLPTKPATIRSNDDGKKKKASRSKNSVCRRIYLNAKDHHKKTYKYVTYRWLYHGNRHIKHSKTGRAITFDDIWAGFNSENPTYPVGEVAKCALPIMMGLSSLWIENDPTLGQKVGEYILRQFV